MSLCVLLMENFGKSLRLNSLLIKFSNQEFCIILCYSVVNCKTYSSKTHAGFSAQNFLQCVLNFTEQEPKPQKPGSLNPCIVVKWG